MSSASILNRYFSQLSETDVNIGTALSDLFTLSRELTSNRADFRVGKWGKGEGRS